MAGVPQKGAAPAWLHLSPPKRLFRLVDDVAPGKADVMSVALAQFGQLAPLKLTLPPDMKGFANSCDEPGTMMICHRFMRAGGHFRLLKIICCLQYLRYRDLPQTTLCAASHDKKS
jgi:hypothetical protein